MADTLLYQVTVSFGGTIVERTPAFDTDDEAQAAYRTACDRHPYRKVEIEVVIIKSDANSYSRRVVY